MASVIHGFIYNADAFAEAVAQNRLEATVDGDGTGTDITITSPPEALLELIVR